MRANHRFGQRDTLTCSHFAVVNVQSTLGTERPRLKASVVRIMDANRIVRSSTFFRAILLIPFRLFGRLFSCLYVLGCGRGLLDLLRLFDPFRRHGGRIRGQGARLLDKSEGAYDDQC